ncbi:MAG: sigma-70 family RNA polymerase sigma factor [Planctomycetes bacterium]|nr:sigma-70 family RNA polymerase sigma factor [Planctomycetota bacterium]
MNEVDRDGDPPRADATETLLKRARAGDAAAFEQLFALHGERLRRSARAKVPAALRGRIDDSDVVQEALVDAVTHLDSFEARGEGSFRRWLSALLRNRLLMTIQHCLGRKKRDARREQRLDSDTASKASGLRLASPQSSPSAAAMRGERRRQLERALATLPADYAQVLRLVRLEEKSIAEAAAAMGRTENAVKKLLARALLALRDALDGGAM